MKLHELKEAALMGRLIYDQIDDSQIVDTIKTHCKESISNLQEKKFLWRGDRNARFFASAAIVNPANTVRKSQNTNNYYTLILDNTPSMSEFPKRSSSLICTTNLHKANEYATEESTLFIVVPFDGVKIGCVNQNDIWDVRTESIAPGQISSLIQMNDMWAHFAVFLDNKGLGKLSQYEWESFKKIDQLIRIDDKVLECFQSAFAIKNADREFFKEHGILKRIDEVYSPSNLGFDVTTPHAIPWYRGEQWVNGKCLFIKAEDYQKVSADIAKLEK